MLILAGTNTGANTITNPISENTGAGALAVRKNGDGTWLLQGNQHLYRRLQFSSAR